MTTSGAYGYTTKKSLAFAYVPLELTGPGTGLKVELLANRYNAKVKKRSPLLTEFIRERAKARLSPLLDR